MPVKVPCFQNRLHLDFFRFIENVLFILALITTSATITGNSSNNATRLLRFALAHCSNLINRP